ncbi:hypothetical protein D3C78_1286460 [compost metagenome]
MQLLDRRPDRVTVQAVAPGFGLRGRETVVVVTGLHIQHHAVDQLLQAGNGTGHRTGGHVLADQHVQQPELVEAVSGLDPVSQPLLNQVGIVGHGFVQIQGEHRIAQRLVEGCVEGSCHDQSLTIHR